MKTKFLKTICTMLAVMLCVVPFSNAQVTTVQQKIDAQSTVRVGDLGIYKVIPVGTTDSPYNYQSAPQASNPLGTSVQTSTDENAKVETPAPVQRTVSDRPVAFTFSNTAKELSAVNNDAKEIKVSSAAVDNFAMEFKNYMTENPNNMSTLSEPQIAAYNKGDYKALYLSYLVVAVKHANQSNSK